MSDGVMKSNHTPGPWHAEDVRGNDESMVYRVIKADNRSVGFAGAYKMADQNEAEANAKLIAAAPSLLKATYHQKCLIEKAQLILTTYLVPDGLSDREVISELLGLLDGPDQRTIKALTENAITSAGASIIEHQCSMVAFNTPEPQYNEVASNKLEL